MAGSVELKNRGEIYLATNTATGKKYVGQVLSMSSNGERRGYELRWKEHLYYAYTKNYKCRALESAISEYGPDIWKVEIITYCREAEMGVLEEKFIMLYDTLYPKGYNLNTGGQGARHTEESRRRMSESMMGHPVSEACRQKLRLARGQKIKVDGNVYISSIEAGSALKIPPSTIRYRLQGKIPGYEYISEEEYARLKKPIYAKIEFEEDETEISA